MARTYIYKDNLGKLIKKNRKAWGMGKFKFAYLIGEEFDFVEDLESGKGLQNIKNYAYHLYANIKLSAVENKDFDNKNTELEKTVKKLEEKLNVENITEEEKQQIEKELYSTNQKLEQLKKCKLKGYRPCPKFCVNGKV